MIKINHDAFFDAYRKAFGRVNASQAIGLEFFLSSIEADEGITDVRWAAYMLATVKHECADTWQPIEEYGKGKGKQYGIAVNGLRYYGRGYVQLTWEDNYRRMGNLLGIDLHGHPELALEPLTAYRIMSLGMRTGQFTGKRLSDYIEGEKCQYWSARRIINRLDRAVRIAGYANVFEHALGAGGEKND